MGFINNKRFKVGLAVGLFLLTLIFTGVVLYRQLVNKTKEPALKQVKVSLNFIASGFNAPTAIAAAPSESKLFVTERSGAIKTLQNDGSAKVSPFLDISTKVQAKDEMGLLGLTFHPSYQQNGYFYINYVDKTQNTVISRYQANPQTGQAEPASEKVILSIKQPYPNHNGGDLQFGPDGYLYIALGDGGGAGDPENRAQNKDSLLGKLLRIDVNGGDPYAIPPTNPYINQSNVRPEVWAYGLRNPWRISFDTVGNQLLIADVGQKLIEEINVQPVGEGGQNYGWRCYEGTKAYNIAGCGPASDYVTPAVEYSHDEGLCSVTGGYVYRGSKYPALSGKYFYGDFCNGQLFYMEQNNQGWQQTAALKTPYQISAFGQATNGELYLTDFATGSVYQLVDVAQ